MQRKLNNRDDSPKLNEIMAHAMLRVKQIVI